MSMKFPGMAGALSVLALLWSAHLSAAGLESRPAQAAPAFLAKDMAGQSHTLADYRGKVVLLNFWASWCPPCRREMPSMERLRLKMAGRPLVILALDLWALVSVVSSDRSTGSKVLWALLVILLPVLGFLVWLVAGPRAAARHG